MTTAIQPAPRRELRHLPISFSDPLVPRVLDGSKTQTRRVTVPPPEGVDGATWVFRSASGFWFPYRDELARGALDQIGPGIRCPYGQPGDLLWVREGLRRNESGMVSYAADDALAMREGKPVAWTWKPKRLPSRYCPRWASRMDLVNDEVRVQRLQDITEEDARAEGISCSHDGSAFGIGGAPETWRASAREAFAVLWDSINGKRPGCAWADSPWVFAVSFQKARP